MNSLNTYLICVVGELDQDEINSKSPYAVTLVEGESSATKYSICADQAGLIGLMRYLHGMGFRFLSINLIETDSNRNKQ